MRAKYAEKLGAREASDVLLLFDFVGVRVHRKAWSHIRFLNGQSKHTGALLRKLLMMSYLPCP